MVKYCKWFKSITYADESIVGRKAATLADLQKADFPVPNGFVITSEAYKEFVKARNLDKKIQEKLKEITPENSKQISKEIQNFFVMSSLSADMLNEVEAYYSYINVAEELRNAPISAFIVSGRDAATVAIRSSAITSPFSHAVLNITGSYGVTRGVLEFWASLFSPEALQYRAEYNIPYEDIDIALIVQRQVNADKSGSTYLKDSNTITLEAIWGMGKSFVIRNFDSSKVLLDKDTMQVVGNYKNEQPWMLAKDFSGKIVKKNVPKDKKSEELLTDKELKILSDLLIKVNEHLYYPQDVEWSIEKNRVFLLQSTQKKIAEEIQPKQSAAISSSTLVPSMPAIPYQKEQKPEPQPTDSTDENRPEPQEPTPVDKLEPYELLKFI